MTPWLAVVFAFVLFARAPIASGESVHCCSLTGCWLRGSLVEAFALGTLILVGAGVGVAAVVAAPYVTETR